jgi:hypothetical protein
MILAFAMLVAQPVDWGDSLIVDLEPSEGVARCDVQDVNGLKVGFYVFSTSSNNVEKVIFSPAAGTVWPQKNVNGSGLTLGRLSSNKEYLKIFTNGKFEAGEDGAFTMTVVLRRAQGEKKFPAEVEVTLRDHPFAGTWICTDDTNMMLTEPK